MSIMNMLKGLSLKLPFGIDFDYTLSAEDRKVWHAIDRMFYIRLVMELRHEFLQVANVIALWLYLEELGYPSIIMAVQNMPDNVVNDFYEEALAIFNCILSERLPSMASNDIITRTNSLMNEEIRLELLYEFSNLILPGISRNYTTMCNEVFDDLIQQFAEMVNAKQFSMHGFDWIPPHQAFSEHVPYMVHNMQKVAFVPGESSNAPHTFKPRTKEPIETRTMFMTFSRGYWVSKEEWRNYLFWSYGDVIESIQMEKKGPYHQPLWARVVFRTAATLMRILNVRRQVKFVIHGKHVLARLFE